MSYLLLKKCGYSRHPWRIGIQHAEPERFIELSHFHFRTKREGVPWLARLQTLPVDWSLHPTQWPEEQRHAAQAILEETPGWQEWQAVVARGLVAPGRVGR